MPPVDASVGEMIGYHIRNGNHDLLQFDWNQFADFADSKLERYVLNQMITYAGTKKQSDFE